MSKIDFEEPITRLDKGHPELKGKPAGLWFKQNDIYFCPIDFKSKSREKIAETLNKHREAIGYFKPQTEKQIFWENKYEEAFRMFKKAKGKEDGDYCQLLLINSIKNLRELYGQKTCGFRECIKPPRSSRSIYCSDKCQGREKGRRKHDRDPNYQVRANMKYYKSL